MIETLKKTAQDAVAALQAAGADKAQANVSYTITHEFNVDGGEFSLFRTLFDKQLAMTAIQGGRKGIVAQNRYDEETLRESAKACLEAAASAQPDENWDFAPLSQNEDFVLGEVKPDTDKLFFRCQELMASVKERFPKIIMEQMIVAHKEILKAKANSYGVLYSTHQGSYLVQLMFSAHEGEKVADERITLSLAPLDERIVCGDRTTGDGFRAENFDIIKDGKLSAFFLSLYAANKLKLPRGKNDSFNVVIAPGDKSIDEIISTIDRGIVIGRFSGGQPSSNGDFSGVAKNSFLIENGKIGPALSETMIAGNLADMLNHLRAISREQVADGMSVLPYMVFDGITISGK